MIRQARRTVCIAGLATLAGACTTGAAVRQPQIALSNGVSARLGGPAPATERAWWHRLNDPEIAQLVERALESNPDVLTALAQIDVARAQRAQSLAAFGLTGSIDVNAQMRRTEIVSGESVAADQSATGTQAGGQTMLEGTERSAGITAGLSWEIDFFRRVEAVREAGDASVAAALANSHAARLSIAAAVADAVYELRSLASQLSDAKEFERLQSDLERFVTAREASGVGSKFDVDRAAARTAQLRASTVRLTGEAKAAHRRLLTLVRRNNESPANPVAPLEPTLPLPADRLPADLLLRRPDVSAAVQRVREQSNRLKSADQELLPRLILQPGVSLFSARSPVRSDSVSAFVGLRLTTPLFDRTRLIAAVREQGANAEVAVIDLERRVDRAFSEADQALTLYRSDVERLPALEAAELRTSRVRSSAARLLTSGLVDVPTVLEAEREWREARGALLEARYVAARRRIESIRAMGGDWEVDSSPSAVEPPAYGA